MAVSTFYTLIIYQRTIPMLFFYGKGIAFLFKNIKYCTYDEKIIFYT